MAVVYRYIGILTFDVLFFQSPGIFHSQESFLSTFVPKLKETSSGVVAVGVFAAENCEIVHLDCILYMWCMLTAYMVQQYACTTYIRHSLDRLSHSSLQASAANTPTATTPEDFSHSWERNVEGKES